MPFAPLPSVLCAGEWDTISPNIRDSSRLICDSCFQYCKGMSGTLELPEALLVIGNDAFYSTGFTGALALPAGLRSIGIGSFSSCRGLTGLHFPETLEHIKNHAFSDCESLGGALMIPDSVRSVGRGAFSGCGITEVSFGANIRSIGEGAFLSCSRLESASLTGKLTPDYYESEEKSPSFPAGCRVNALSGTVSWRETWENANTSEPPSEGDSGGAAKEMPYFWTDGLKQDQFAGSGTYADVTMEFDGSNIKLSVNGRPAGEIAYSADPNEYENRVVSTSGFYCCDGVIQELRFRDGYNHDRQLIAELTCDDGEVRRVVFHTGSEESLYIDGVVS